MNEEDNHTDTEPAEADRAPDEGAQPAAAIVFTADAEVIPGGAS